METSQSTPTPASPKPPLRKAAPRQSSQPQPQSPGLYIAISAGGFIAGTALLVFYLKNIDQFSQHGQMDRIYYLIMIPFALASAATLFGLMRGYARYSGKALGGRVELGGPAALFVIVLLLGFQLGGKSPTSVSFTVRASGPNGAMINSGTILLQAGPQNASMLEYFDKNGDAHFENLPASIQNTEVSFIPSVDGYDVQPIQVKLDSAVLNLALKRPNFKIQGHISPAPAIANVLIEVTALNSPLQTRPTADGNYSIEVPGALKDVVHLKVFCGNQADPVIDEDRVLGNSFDLELKERTCLEGAR